MELDPLEAGVNAYRRGEYAEAYEFLSPLAESGDPEARYQIGRMLYYGHGIHRNFGSAASFFKKAAEAGHIRAQYFLGSMYWEGRGVRRSFPRARLWLKSAASRGDGRAMALLGHMHIYGIGAAKNYARAFQYSYQAHKLGDPHGTVNVGWFYEHGFVAEKNLERARRFYESAARRGVAHGFHNLGVLYLHGIGVTKDEGKARQLLQQAAVDGDQEAVDLLCRLDQKSPKGVLVTGRQPAGVRTDGFGRILLHEAASPDGTWRVEVFGPNDQAHCLYACARHTGGGIHLFSLGWGPAQPQQISVRWDLPNGCWGIFIDGQCWALHVSRRPRAVCSRGPIRSRSWANAKPYSEEEIRFLCAKRRGQRKGTKGFIVEE